MRWIVFTALLVLVGIGVTFFYRVASVAFRIPEWDEWEPDPIPAAQRDVAGRYTHVRAFLSSIPQPIRIATERASFAVPHAPTIYVRSGFRAPVLRHATVELTREGRVVGRLFSRSVLVPHDASRLLVLDAYYGDDVLLAVVRLDGLTELPDGAPDSREAEERIYDFDDDACESMVFPRDLGAGVHAFEFPESISDVDEILVLYQSTHPDAGGRNQMLVVEPWHGSVRVILPTGDALQDIDSDHWPQRLFRDPKTGRVVGDGIRLRPFVLSEDLTRIECWLE